MGTDTLMDRLVHSPRLGLYVDRLRAVLDEEQKKRERFYDVMSGQKKEEFINGEVIGHSPVKLKHELVSGLLCNLAKTYVAKHRLGHVGHEKLLVCLTRNDYEPDLCYFDKAQAANFTPDQMKFPAPKFIAEILSPSTEALDRGLKFEDYAAHEVHEYWIVDPDGERVEQYLLAGEAYELQLKVNSGTLQSLAIQGFEIHVRAMFDEQENLAALSRMLGVTA